MIKIAGIRCADDVGRVVTPKEPWELLGIAPRSPLEIFVDGACIVIGKYAPTVYFVEKLTI